MEDLTKQMISELGLEARVSLSGCKGVKAEEENVYWHHSGFIHQSLTQLSGLEVFFLVKKKAASEV